MRSNAVKYIKRRLLNLIYPPHCFVCGDIAPWGYELCPTCRDRLPIIHTKRCAKCGKPVESTQTLCDDCRKRVHLFDEGRGLMVYDETMRQAMAYLKYKHRREYGYVMGKLLYEGSRDKLAKWQADAIVPIPIHKKRRRERGYNQAEEIARAVSDLAKIPLRPELLLRSHATVAMKKLNAKERQKNLQSAFVCPYHFRQGIRLILIDDIYTTGATIDAAAGVLKAAGCSNVFFLSVCIGGGFMVRY